MERFGGSKFKGFTIPLVFDGHYFIMEPGDPPLVTVVSEKDGKPFFEVLKNEPRDNPLSEATKPAPGTVTVSAKSGSGFLYKIHPGPRTNVVFSKRGGGEVTARITDSTIQVGGVALRNNTFVGDMTGVSVMPDGTVRIGARVPLKVIKWLRDR
jgi:hypothetical protein